MSFILSFEGTTGGRYSPLGASSYENQCAFLDESNEALCVRDDKCTQAAYVGRQLSRRISTCVRQRRHFGVLLWLHRDTFFFVSVELVAKCH